jgi:hypothetical protein
VELQGLVHWYVSGSIHQEKDFNFTIDQSRYTTPILTRFLESAGIKKINLSYDSILPIDYVLTSNDLTTTPDESSEIQEAYNLEYASCIVPLMYMSYKSPGISSVNKLAKYSNHPGEKHIRALIQLLHYIKHHTKLWLTYYYDVTTSPVYQLLQENNITPPRHMFTFCDSSWDDDHDTSKFTGGFLIFYQGGVVDHSSNTPELVAMISAEAEYNEACMDCMTTSHMRMTLNPIVEVEDISK